MTARRASTLAVATASAAVLLAALLVTWAASIGPNEVFHGTGPVPETAAPTAQPTDPPAEPRPDTDLTLPRRDGDSFSLLWLMAVVLNVATAVLALYLLYRLGRWALRLRLERRRLRAQQAALAQAGEFEVLEPIVALAREMTADAQAQREALASGSPRNAVVACWHRFETQAADAGIERRAWETSSEYMIRVLDLADADPHAVATLGTLYREARFSQHELTETDRAVAVEALDAIHATIGVRA
ncbi:DUF4129 domain-containing protein [Nocardioides sp. CN2-186]|uniref:DUF4129 domain-containing protein n=1 Tax=Nocardioides tweenelious TaxID=3156607 RepID=UPI0032B3EF61